jgi:hypothetical protein
MLLLNANSGWIGQTDPESTSWNDYTGPTPETSGLYVDVDFAAAGFTKVPFITANLMGQDDTWVMEVQVAMVTSTTARIYIRSTVAGYTPTAAMASSKQWNALYYLADPSGGAGLTLYTYTILTQPCDMS